MRENLPITQNEHVLPTTLVSKTDLKGRITFVNEAFVAASGFSTTELTGKAHNIVRHPDMPEEAFAERP
jgi:PAS domain S-box-containing protein